MALFSALTLIFVFFGASTTAGSASKPNIVFVLVDDWGYADVGFRNPAIKSPNFDELAASGVLLNRHYVFKYCSPSRASLLTGRWPHHAHQWNPPENSPVGVNINMTLLPAKLKQAGYKTHMVGKWHEGFFQKAYFPVNRGFDTSSGFLGGGEDHFTQKVGCAYDFWKNRSPDSRVESYDAYNYRDDLNYIFANHNQQSPLFLYLPLHNVHGPFEAPPEWLDLYDKNSTCDRRRTYQAMVSVADNVTALVVYWLKKTGMWENTLLVVSADNGGAPCAGSNHPLKGCKGTFFEGGVRALAFASGGLIPKEMQGKSIDGFIHIADWYPTFCKMAGVDPDDSGPGRFAVDGVDVWPLLIGEATSTSHDEIVLGYNFGRGGSDKSNSGAIISGDYKLVVGSQEAGCDSVMWSPLDYPCTQGPTGPDCDPYCLYNIVEDPEEKHDLSSTSSSILRQMLDRYNKFSKEPHEEQDQGYHTPQELPSDANACPYMHAHGGYWQPWKDMN